MIVVADDDLLVQQTCKACLEAAGFRVLLAATGVEAMDAISRHQVYGIVIDIFMPDMDGIETLLLIKKKNPAVPVIVMSGGGTGGRMDFLAAASRFGADAVVPKPFTGDQLVGTVKRCSSRMWAL